MGMSEDDPRFARSVDTYLAIVGESAQGVALALAHKLRQAGIQVEARYGAKSLKAHMKNADRVGAHRVIMLGEDELNRQEVTVRDMRTREQAQVSLDSVVSYLQGVAS
jgi:histidyl-tRNA synthetase